MNEGRWGRRVAEVAVGILIAATIVLASSRTLSPILAFALVTASLSPLFDIVDLLVRLRLRAAVVAENAFTAVAPDVSPLIRRQREFVVSASIHNAEDEIPGFVHSSKPYLRHLWLIDDASTDHTTDVLRARGIRCLQGPTNVHKPGALKQLVSSLPQSVEAVLVLDPDTKLMAPDGGPPPIEEVVEDMFRRGHAAVCPRVSVRRDCVLTTLQSFEYALSVSLGRSALGDVSVTSGISLYRRSDLEETLAQHSLSVYAEDLENTLLLLAAGKSILLDERIVAETEGQTSLRGLFSQRIGWAFGHLRVYWERRAELRKVARRGPVALYQFVVYLGLISIVMHPLRQVGALLVGASLIGTLAHIFGLSGIPQSGLADPLVFATVYVQYFALSLLALFTAVPRADRIRTLPVLPLFPLYALLMTIPVSIGFLNWLSVCLWKRRLISDHFDDTRRITTGLSPAIVRPLPGEAG